MSATTVFGTVQFGVARQMEGHTFVSWSAFARLSHLAAFIVAAHFPTST